MTESTPNHVFVVLVHGTFASNADWTKADSDICQALKKGLEGNVTFHRFQWSGGNSHHARIQASKELAAYLSSLNQDKTGGRCFVVTHSHGGNVAMMALKNSILNGAVQKIVCLATPFIHCSARGIQAAANKLGTILAFSCFFSIFIYIGLVSWKGENVSVGIVAGLVVLSVALWGLIKPVAKWLGKRSEALVSDLSLPKIKIPVLGIRVQWDEAGALLRIQHVLSEWPHKMWKSRIIKWLFVLSLGLLAGYDLWPKPGEWNLIRSPEAAVFAFIYMSVLAYVAWMLSSQFFMALIPRITRSTPMGFGWEGVLTPWLVKVSAEKIPDGFPQFQLESCSPPTRGLRHSWVYRDKDSIDRIVNWLNDGD